MQRTETVALRADKETCIINIINYDITIYLLVCLARVKLCGILIPVGVWGFITTAIMDAWTIFYLVYFFSKIL